MQAGEDRALHWFVRADGPVPLSLYRTVAAGGAYDTGPVRPPYRRARRPGQSSAIAAGITGMSTQAALDAGLLNEADVWGAFGVAPPERGPN